MLKWFSADAPIRIKFKILGTIYTSLAILAGTGAIAGTASADMLSPTVSATIALVASATTCLVALVSARLICTPYVNTVLRMEAMAAGDLDSPVLYVNHRDCVGRMTKAMSTFRQNAISARLGDEVRMVVSELGGGLSRLARCDLDQELVQVFPREYEQLRIDFNAAISSLRDAMRSVAESASGINAGASEIRQASDDLSHRTEQQAASLEETAAAVDEITTAVRKTAEGANRANELAGEARSDAEQGGEVVRRAVEAVSDIERSAIEISEIITVIDGIAFQTNLLALNAGVEAARAGDVGRGFAVVASEVRALAQRSADAAKDVKARITSSSERIGTGVVLVNETGKSLDRIIARISEVSNMIAVIASSAQQQATGLQQVNTAVSEMDNVTQRNAAMVEEATAAARSLAGEAEELDRQVARFELGHDAALRKAMPAPIPARNRAYVMRVGTAA
jgi:methyl-accepting chemotaxis protein